MKPHSPACDRNKEPILAVLREHFADRREVLEIGSRTAQHAVHFAAAMPWLRWQCTDHEDALEGMRAWLDEAGLPNTPPPFALLAVAGPSPGFSAPLPRRYDAVFSANTLHIMSWAEVEGLFAGLRDAVTDDGVVAVYGPFNLDGAYTSESNREFDAWLKTKYPLGGIRDREAVMALAQSVGLRAVADVAMPANNRLLVWRRGSMPIVGSRR